MARSDHQSVNPRIAYIIQNLEAQADKSKVDQFQRYLKTDQPMFGVNAGPRKEILKASLREFPIQEFDEFFTFTNLLWQSPYRECQYCAIDAAVRFKKFHSMQAWPLFEHMALTAKWWDLTDGIAVNLIGSLLLANRSLQDILDQWMRDPDLWVRRTALLAHLKHKRQTDTECLSRTILTLNIDKQFFIQKAIGWSLREYSKIDANWVLQFIDEHGDSLSNLALREGLKFLNKT
ncbi:MAG: DNA alkylation repair protein [Reinekea sp.]|jgi:3-methyladenine DNA glycosylase AlkD|nr:DNA alkylation repair protein [Reinekea sp.]